MTVNEMKQELGKMVWNMACSLVHGGRISPVEFRDYVLTMLFYRFISEQTVAKADEIDPEFDYANQPNKEIEDNEGAKQFLLSSCGCVILPEQLFSNVAKKSAQDKEFRRDLNVFLPETFKAIEESSKGTDSEEAMKGLFESFNTGKTFLGEGDERNELLAELIEGVRNLPISKYKDAGFDVFGYCYEYLIYMYAVGSGKSGGEFYTPSEVSELLARLAIYGRSTVNRVYDPACGSGSLLLKFKALGIEPKGGYYGQEINATTHVLARMNMFLHNENATNFHIDLGDTLINPKRPPMPKNETDTQFLCDAIVSNPPYAVPWKGDDDPTLINDDRYAPAGVLAPKSKADFAFMMHILSRLSADGTAAVVEFPGILYRGGAEGKIRKYIVDNNFVDAVISLPQNLFFGTSIATSILVLKKNKTDDKIAFIDASNEFIHVGNKNQLSPENIAKIYDAVINKSDIEHFSKVSTLGEVQSKAYNLTVTTYVEKPDDKEEIDIHALRAELKRIVAREEELRRQIEELTAGME